MAKADQLRKFVPGLYITATLRITILAQVPIKNPVISTKYPVVRTLFYI